MEENDIGFSRLNLKEGDSLVVKIDISNLSEEDSTKKIKEVRDDPFIKFVESKGHSVFVTYTGVDLNILRLQETDRVIAYVNVTDMSEEESTKYIDYVDFKLRDQIGKDKLIIVPVKNNSPTLNVMKENKEDKNAHQSD
jgi:hypothetical protein